MMRGRRPSRSPPGSAGFTPDRHLPYVVELWNLPRTAPERIVARAASPFLARAVFAAARSEHLGRKIVLRCGAEVLLETE